MPLLTALAISIAALGGLATFLVLGPLGGLDIQIWAMFIAWACFFHCGGAEAGLKSTIINNVFGVVCAWIALMLITQIPLAGVLGLPLWAAICVAATIVLLVMAANIPALSVIPAGFYGYAATAGYALVGSHLGTLTSVSMLNPALGIAVSLVLGALFAYASQKIAGVLTKPAPQAANA